MKTFVAILACLGNMIIVLWLLAALQAATASEADKGVTTVVNLFTIVVSIADITVGNYLIWKAVKKAK